MTSKSKRQKNGKAFEATCPACGSPIRLRKMPGKGQFITCFECDTMLEVVRLAPLKLEWAFESPFESPFDSQNEADPGQDGHYVEDAFILADEWFDSDDYYEAHLED
jgi:lysine biosynthesis protein LysW